MRAPWALVGRSAVVAFLVVILACGKTIDPNAPKSQCTPGCNGNSVCELSLYSGIALCEGSAPINCGAFDGSAPHCDPITGRPCATAISCVSVPNCSPDDCNCLVATICGPAHSSSSSSGECIQTSSGALDFFCWPS